MASSEAAATIQDIQNDLQNLRNDVAQLAQQMTALVSETGEEAVGQLRSRVRQMRDGLDEAVTGAGERGREALGEVSDNLGEAIETSLREHPLTTVGLAIGLGFLFGTAWRR